MYVSLGIFTQYRRELMGVATDSSYYATPYYLPPYIVRTTYCDGS